MLREKETDILFWRKNSAALLASVALVAGGTVATAASASASASAAQTCPANSLCLYSGTGFNPMRTRAWSTYICEGLHGYFHMFDREIMSYRNNLPVKATFWHTSNVTTEWVSDGTTGVGAFSRNTSNSLSGAILVCTGGRSPYWPGVDN
ncbi:peptidase inhibitor family I36 protein [Streptomyces scabiei]|uniref:peptidase inhibitor family I36 protein n=1 Tax=Streptomyces scabiei TaxID=1930 RepID=UPI00099E36F1|nr:peptidase inhibitor family I36 protein [Streptomyces scabiei]